MKVEAISRPDLNSVQNPTEQKGAGRKMRIERCRAAMALLDMLPPKKRIELQEAHKPAVTETAVYWGKPESDEFFGHIDFAFRVIAEAKEQLEIVEADKADNDIESMIENGELVYVEDEVTFDEDEDEDFESPKFPNVYSKADMEDAIEDSRQFTVNVNGNAVTMAQTTEEDEDSDFLSISELLEMIEYNGGLDSLMGETHQAGQGLTTLDIGRQLGFQLGLPQDLFKVDKSTGGLTVSAIGSLAVALYAQLQMPLSELKDLQKRFVGKKGGSMFGACLRWALKGDFIWASMQVEKWTDGKVTRLRFAA